MKGEIPSETFALLTQFKFLAHAFTLRTIEDTRSDTFETRIVRAFSLSGYASAEQPHGNSVAVVAAPGRVAGVDALVTREPGLPLVIRCADCAPVFIVDRCTPAIALVHSGKKGTFTNVVGQTLQELPGADFAFIGPSIGPCHYEIDLWTGIETQLRNAGVTEIHNPRVCTACHLDRYFSYRAERGQTGRMFAVLMLRSAGSRIPPL